MKKDRQQALPKVDERNFARLGVVSIQTRLDDEASRSWSSAFEIAGRSFGVAAEALHGRPRGIDTNVVIGIESLFAARSCPEDNRLHTTAYELRAASFLPLNGKSFHRLRECLDRLWYTNVTVTDGWHLPDGRKLRNVKRMRMINDLSYWDIDGSDQFEATREFVPNATLTIQLGTHMANSIRLGFTQALEHKILTGIEQPPARALYRLLEAHRYADTGEQQRSLAVRLEDWRLACGITDGKPSKTLRALNEAHEELVAQGYLRDVRVAGTRATTTLTYVFASLDDPDPALVRLLVDSGVAAPAANKLAKEKGDRVEEVVRYVQATMREKPGSVRKPGGLINDMLQRPEKYVLSAPRPDHNPEEGREKSRARIQAAEIEAQRRTELERLELLAASSQTQWERTRRPLKLLLSKQLSAAQWDALERACQTGQLQAGSLLHELSAAQARLELQAFVDRLRDTLR
ncbi:replication initiator protein A [Deinococcus aquaedulcis]|uniref:replication initiator protein A n=1 Tax=Deinococcus aquaedulcis TaxID=2840455 RepID=UPI001C83349E|nr:replication initiator protein A [Deinococcus aquaedulcis]